MHVYMCVCGGGGEGEKEGVVNMYALTSSGWLEGLNWRQHLQDVQQLKDRYALSLFFVTVHWLEARCIIAFVRAIHNQSR